MLLSAYRATTRLLLANPSATTGLYTDSDLDRYINLARAQMASESECVRAYGSLAITAPVAQYALSLIATGNAAAPAAISVRQLSLRSGSTSFSTPMAARPFEWFNSYILQNPAQATAAPTTWAIFGQGQQGTLFINPPDTNYTLFADVACLPIDLVDDMTVDAIPYPWTDAVPYYATFYAYMSSQRQQDADVAYKRYEEFVARARMGTTPSQYPRNTNQSGSPGTVKTGVQTVAPLPAVGPQGGDRH